MLTVVDEEEPYLELEKNRKNKKWSLGQNPCPNFADEEEPEPEPEPALEKGEGEGEDK